MQKTSFYPDTLYFDTRVRSFLEHKLAQPLPKPDSPEFKAFIHNLQVNNPKLFSEVERILQGSSVHHRANRRSIKQLLPHLFNRPILAIKAKRHLVVYLLGGLSLLIPVLYLIGQALYPYEPVYLNTPLVKGSTVATRTATFIPKPRVMVQIRRDLPVTEMIAVPVPQVSSQIVQSNFAESLETIAKPPTIPIKTVSDSSMPNQPTPKLIGNAVDGTSSVEVTVPSNTAALEAVSSEPITPIPVKPASLKQTGSSTPTVGDVITRPETLSLHTVNNAPPKTLKLAQGERPSSLTLIKRSTSP